MHAEQVIESIVPGLFLPISTRLLSQPDERSDGSNHCQTIEPDEDVANPTVDIGLEITTIADAHDGGRQVRRCLILYGDAVRLKISPIL